VSSVAIISPIFDCMKFLIVGLGNPGEEYAHTRHNIGYDVAWALVTKHSGSFKTDRLAYTAEIKWKGKKFVCICPTTFMNLSGKAVKYWMDKEKIPVEGFGKASIKFSSFVISGIATNESQILVVSAPKPK